MQESAVASGRWDSRWSRMASAVEDVAVPRRPWSCSRWGGAAQLKCNADANPDLPGTDWDCWGEREAVRRLGSSSALGGWTRRLDWTTQDWRLEWTDSPIDRGPAPCKDHTRLEGYQRGSCALSRVNLRCKRDAKEIRITRVRNYLCRLPRAIAPSHSVSLFVVAGQRHSMPLPGPIHASGV